MPSLIHKRKVVSILQDNNLMKERLVDVIDTSFSSQAELARVLGITYQSLNNKLNGRSDFTRKEIKTIATFYNLSEEDIYYIFFEDGNDGSNNEYV